jgi:hypothetical protein
MIKTSRLIWATCIAVVGLAVMATPARAQSAIAGTVKDTSGAVMPGVTVEASSPVLIEKARTTVTDENGQYRIIDLRPGTYALTFTLAGFNTIKRELDLPANFTATINADLNVGTLEESVTVSGASPVVDVQSNQTQQTLTREMLDAVPTARTIQGLGQLVVGVTLSQPDVGGSRAMQQTYFSIRGTNREQTIVTVDGQITNGLMFDGGVQAYHNEAMVQETVFRTAGGNAEAISGGLNLNLIPKDGGNQFSGNAYAHYSPSSWQGNNLSDSLQAQGVVSVDKIDRFYEFAISEGGPIVRDKVWFFASYRRARYDKPVANTIDDQGAQGVSDEVLDNPVIRGTWQISQKHKLAAYTDRAFRFRGHAMEAGDDPETASVAWHTPTFMTGSVKWTSTLTNNMLLEAGFSMANQRYDNKYQDGIEQPRGTLGWYQNVSKVDNGNSTRFGASAAQLGNYPNRRNFAVSTSYVTGAHNVKVGVQNSWGNYHLWRNANADLYQLYTNGVPNQVTVLNTPLNWEQELDYNLGVYAQDSWSLNRLTLNYGLRLDTVRERVVGQDAQSGRFASSSPYDDIQLPRWTNLSPRASVVYDLFGNGKTAVRFGFNKFMTNVTVGLAELYNPTGLQTFNLPWTDLNGDDIAQGERGCTYQTAGCEINFGPLPSSFGIRALSTFDPDLRRPYMYAYNLGMQHELLPGFSVTAEWFRNDFKDLMARNNMARDADSYTPVDVVSPLDGRVLTVYNVKTAFQSAVQNVDSTDPDLKQTYNGLELNFNARLGGGARIFGGFVMERTVTNSCSAADRNPNLLLFCDGAENDIPWNRQFKVSFNYPLPWHGVAVSGAFQALPGYTLGTTPLLGGFQAREGGLNQPNGLSTQWQITPSTRYAANCSAPCRPNELVIPGQNGTLTIPLLAPGTERTPRLTQLDLSVTKPFQFAGLHIAPKLDFFNVLNSDDYFTVRTLVFGGSTYLQPGTIMQGRIIRLGAELKW